jgi:N-acetylglutamate synthase-like GNAT family acetyltransferase
MISETNIRQSQLSHLIIRAFSQDDIPEIISILKENDLYDDREILTDLYVLISNENIVGVVQITPYPEYYFLSYMAIRIESQKKGMGSYLLNNILIRFDKPIYLFTIISDFYERFGFKIVNGNDILPPKDDAACRICIPEKCRTMKWEPGRITLNI